MKFSWKCTLHKNSEKSQRVDGISQWYLLQSHVRVCDPTMNLNALHFNTLAFHHTTLKIRHPVRSGKSSSVGPGQYFDRRRHGTPGCGRLPLLLFYITNKHYFNVLELPSFFCPRNTAGGDGKSQNVTLNGQFQCNNFFRHYFFIICMITVRINMYIINLHLPLLQVSDSLSNETCMHVHTFSPTQTLRAPSSLV